MLFAFIAMGGWAIFANAAYPMPQPVIAGAVQGTMSALLTLFLKKSVDVMRPRFTGHFSLWTPPLISSIGSATLLIGAHWVAGTPEILATVAVPLTVSVTYIFAYNLLSTQRTVVR